MAALRKGWYGSSTNRNHEDTNMDTPTIVEMKRKPLYTTQDMAKAGGVGEAAVRMAKSRGEIEPYDPDMRDMLYTADTLVKFAQKRNREVKFT